MAHANDFLDDVTGDPIALSTPPIVIRINAGLCPGSGPIDLLQANLSPFLLALLQMRVSRIELSAETFDRLFTVDIEGMAPAFLEGDRSLVDELARLRAENAAYQAKHGALPPPN